MRTGILEGFGLVGCGLSTNLEVRCGAAVVALEDFEMVRSAVGSKSPSKFSTTMLCYLSGCGLGFSKHKLMSRCIMYS